MAFPEPTSPATMRDTLRRFCRSYRMSPPGSAETAAIVKILTAFFNKFPEYEFRVENSLDNTPPFIIRAMRTMAGLFDDVNWPIESSTELDESLTEYFDQVSLARYTGHGTAYNPSGTTSDLLTEEAEFMLLEDGGKILITVAA